MSRAFPSCPSPPWAWTTPSASERVSTGIPRLDGMLGGQGYYRGSSVLVSGTAGTGKSSLAAIFADAACRRGERCLYLAFEESQAQIIRNMRSIGLDLEPWVEQGALEVPCGPLHPLRPGDAPGRDPQADQRISALDRDHGPHHQSLHRGQ